MFHHSRRHFLLSLLALLVASLALLATPAPAQNGKEADKEEPAFRDYKGVRIGMTADEARKKLGNPADKGDAQDLYTFSDDETAQVYYDGEKKVMAISVTYFGKSGMPTAKAVLGSDVEAKPDGSAHKLVRYPKAGYWVSYTRTAGDAPMTIVAVQKIQ